MKLLYITNSINGSGGLERVLASKIKALIDIYDYEVEVLCLNNGHEQPFYNFSSNITFVSIPYYGCFFKSLALYKSGIMKVVSASSPDIILVCDDGFKGFIIPRWIKNIPIIYERHASINLNTDNSLKGKLQKYLMRKLAKKFDKFVVLTPSNMQEWNLPNIVAIPNSLPFKGLDSLSHKHTKKIIVVGSHSYNKGYDRLCEIWKKITAQTNEWELDIYGKIDANETYIRMAKDMQLERITFYPPVQAIEEVYQEASILLLPSRSEGFGMILIEAMAFGVPCISFDCPSGPRDIITNAVDGFLIANGDIDAFVQKTLALINDADLRNEMGKNAIMNAQRYHVEAIAKQWDELFRGLQNDYFLYDYK